MTYTPATLTGKFEKPDGTPAVGYVKIIPNSVAIIDQAGNLVLAGPLTVQLDTTGAFTVDLPPTDDPALEPATGRQYTISTRLHHTNRLPTLTGIELDGGTTSDYADLVSGVEATATISTWLTESEYDALVSTVASKETPTGAQSKADAALAAAEAYTDSHVPTIATASTTVQGIVELATNAETTTGTDAVRAVTPSGVKAAIDALVNGAPGALDTLKELADQLANDESAASALTNLVGTKLDKASAPSINALDVGVKGDVATITDAAITSGQATLTRSGSTKFTAADVGKYVQVVGAGTPFNNRGAWTSSTSYAFNDLVTFSGNTYVAGAAISGSSSFNLSGWKKAPANSQTLMAKINSVSGGVATLDATAGTTVSGATCTYGTDDSPTITALGSGDYYFPGGRTYFLADWFMPSDTTVRVAPGATFKIPRYASTDVGVFRLMTSNRTLTSFVENIHLRGTIRVDGTELTPPSGTIPRGVHVLNCRDWSIDRLIGINLPGNTGNTLQVGANTGLATATRGKVGVIHSRGVRGIGSSCVQHTAGTDIEYGVLTCDGGLAFRNEMDANASAVITDNVKVQLTYANGDSGFPNAATYLSPHANTLRNVDVGSILAEGGADGTLLEYSSGGSVSDVTIHRMRVTGGGAGVATSQNDRVFPGVTIYDAHVDGAALAPGLRNTGGRMVGVGFALADGITYVNARATNCAANGFKDVFSSTGVVANSRATMINCEATSNTGPGIYIRALDKLTILSGQTGDNPAFVTPLNAQMLPSNAYTGTLAGWTAAGGASGVSGSGGVLTVTSNGTATGVTARTASGTGGVAVTAGHYYKAVAAVGLGTAAAGSKANCTLWFYKSDGSVATGGTPNGSTAVVIPSTGTAPIAFGFQAPSDAAYVALVMEGYHGTVGTTVPSGWTYLFSGLAVQEVAGLAPQTYGLQVDAGSTVQHVGLSFIANGLGTTTGAGTVVDMAAGGLSPANNLSDLASAATARTNLGLGSVDNTADTAKPVSTAQQTALDLKAPLASPTFTGTVGGVTKSMVGLGSVDNTADTAKPVSSAQQTALDLKAPLASPTFTGTVSGVTKSHVGLGSVDNTADTAKPVSTAQQTALDLKADKSVTVNAWTPARNKLLSANFHPNMAGSTRGTTSGQPFYVKVPWESTATIANIVIGLRTLGATLTASDNLLGLYTVSGTTATLIAQSADQSAVWASPGTIGNKTTALSTTNGGSLTNVPGSALGWLVVAILAVGTTAPQWYASVAGNASIPDITCIGLAAADGYTAFQVSGQTGLTALPTSFSFSAATAQGVVPFVGLS